MICEDPRIQTLTKRIRALERERNDVVRLLRKECKHLTLIELVAGPPSRMCADCGAVERGWYCGYQILAMRGDFGAAPYKNDRRLALRTSDSHEFWSFSESGPRYYVGQSHPNFAGGGHKTYEQLTELPEEII